MVKRIPAFLRIWEICTTEKTILCPVEDNQNTCSSYPPLNMISGVYSKRFDGSFRFSSSAGATSGSGGISVSNVSASFLFSSISWTIKSEGLNGTRTFKSQRVLDSTFHLLILPKIRFTIQRELKKGRHDQDLRKIIKWSAVSQLQETFLYTEFHSQNHFHWFRFPILDSTNMFRLGQFVKPGSWTRIFPSMCEYLRPLAVSTSVPFLSAGVSAFSPFIRSFSKSTKRYEKSVGCALLSLFSRQRHSQWSIQSNRSMRSWITVRAWRLPSLVQCRFVHAVWCK